MNIVGDLDKYTQYAAAQSMTIAAANPSGAAGIGAGLAAGAAMGQAMAGALHTTAAPSATEAGAPSKLSLGGPGAATAGAVTTKFCIECGHSIPGQAHFCPDCGKPQ
jgi:membrane protease subunit (stomatin/prohibitin family)